MIGDEEGNEKKYVVFHLGESGFAIDAGCVVEMLQLANITPLPVGAPWSRGVINLRGRVLPVVDLRMRLGLKSLEDETVALDGQLNQAVTYFEGWIASLAQTAGTGAAFEYPCDPAETPFGAWHAGYQPTNLMMETQVGKFASPMRRMADVAKQVVKLVRNQEFSVATDLVERLRRCEFSVFSDLCQQTGAILLDSTRELAVVVEVKGLPRPVALTVDQVDAVDTLRMPEGQVSFGGGDFVNLTNPLISEMALFRDESLVGVLDLSDPATLS